MSRRHQPPKQDATSTLLERMQETCQTCGQSCVSHLDFGQRGWFRTTNCPEFVGADGVVIQVGFTAEEWGTLLLTLHQRAIDPACIPDIQRLYRRLEGIAAERNQSLAKFREEQRRQRRLFEEA